MYKGIFENVCYESPIEDWGQDVLPQDFLKPWKKPVRIHLE
jgi:hypothetical protein